MITSVKSVAQKQKITSEEGLDRDVIAYAADGNDAVVQVFFIRGGKVLGREHFFVRIAMEEDILTSFIKQYDPGTEEKLMETLRKMSRMNCGKQR